MIRTGVASNLPVNLIQILEHTLTFSSHDDGLVWGFWPKPTKICTSAEGVVCQESGGGCAT